jgi:hypothetical protein
MTLIPNTTQKACFIACDKNKIDRGECSCINNINDQIKIPCLVFIGYIFEAHAKCEKCGEPEWKHKII